MIWSDDKSWRVLNKTTAPITVDDSGGTGVQTFDSFVLPGNTMALQSMLRIRFFFQENTGVAALVPQITFGATQMAFVNVGVGQEVLFDTMLWNTNVLTAQRGSRVAKYNTVGNQDVTASEDTAGPVTIALKVNLAAGEGGIFHFWSVELLK